jgi:AraC family transcriptional regulator, regulatory protein of adaptative response / DNA-3-methyladenine glycosylase II
MTLYSDDASADAYYQAALSRDARFDGCFFTCVTTTRIYCRPVCRVKAPKRENCRFVAHAAQAEAAGYRPCLRCRPELAPHSLIWSTQDASHTLALQAARLWDDAGQLAMPSVAQVAARLGVSDRHLRRIFEVHLGVSPVQYLQTRRLLCAKQLLTDTRMPMADVAVASGFGSLRRFNTAFVQHYRLAPTRLRREGAENARRSASAAPSLPSSKQPANSTSKFSAAAPRTAAQRAQGTAGTGTDASHRHVDTGGAHVDTGSTRVQLAYRPPYDVQAMLDFLRQRQIDTIENIAARAGFTWVTRTFSLKNGTQNVSGWLQWHFDEARCVVQLDVSDSLRSVLPTVITRMRGALDLDADPAAINAVLGAHFAGTEGIRVPGCVDGFEVAVRAIVGQQVTVAAACTFTKRIAHAFGEPFAMSPFTSLSASPAASTAAPCPQLTRLFPTPAALAHATSDALGALGIVRQRQAAIIALAQAVDSGQLDLNTPARALQTIDQLKALPGIGDWTAQYIAMRALRWPDAFPAGDVALHNALGLRGEKNPARAAQAASQVWRPWRSYAVLRAWQTLVKSP